MKLHRFFLFTELPSWQNVYEIEKKISPWIKGLYIASRTYQQQFGQTTNPAWEYFFCSLVLQ